jgi:hypothetical protein
MKFIFCHIENFGKLSDFSFEFTEGTNVICEGNGWGKSTFAAFIRAMFYGLEGDRKKNPLESERKKYKPWQGGVFGGQLIFEIKGKQYEISRIFYDREQSDEFELRDVNTNLPSKDYSKKIGEEIFQIDRESFLRTVFLGQNDCETSTTDNINARIGNLADGANELNNFDTANAKLSEILSSLTPSRASGTLAKRREEIAQCERMVKEGEGLSEQMELCQEKMREQEEIYSTLKGGLKDAGRISAGFAGKAEWMRLKNEVEERRGEGETVATRFPGKIPELSEVKEQIAKCTELAKAYERLSLYQLSPDEEKQFSFLTDVFWDDVPSTQELDAKIKEATELTRLYRECSTGQMSAKERERQNELAAHFADESKNAASIAADWAKCCQKRAALSSNQEMLAAVQESVAPPAVRTKTYSFLFVAGILLAAIGIVAAAMYSPLPGAVAAVLGIGVTGVSIQKKVALQMAEDLGEKLGNFQKIPDKFWDNLDSSCQVPDEFSGGERERKVPARNSDMQGGEEKASSKIENLQRTLAQDEAFIKETQKRTAAYLKAHGRTFEGLSERGVTLALQEIMAESAEYESLRKKARNTGGTITQQIAKLQNSIGSFLGKYGISSPQTHFADELYSLKERALTYIALADKRRKFEKAQTVYERIRSGIAAFYEEYEIEPERNITLQLNHILDAVYDYANAVEAFDRAVDELQQFEEKNDTSLYSLGSIDPQSGEETISLLALNEEMERARDERAKSQKIFEDLEEQYGIWEENRIKLAQLKELQDEQQKKYDLVFLAKEKLTQAKEAITSKYAIPILRAFVPYYEMITGMSAAQFRVNANAQLSINECGKQREVNALSLGWRDLIGICLRVAFVDIMYQQEIPVLIMDDPFTNLDDEKIAAGKEFLTAIAKKYQIIYFTCSSARS